MKDKQEIVVWIVLLLIVIIVVVLVVVRAQLKRTYQQGHHDGRLEMWRDRTITNYDYEPHVNKFKDMVAAVRVENLVGKWKMRRSNKKLRMNEYLEINSDCKRLTHSWYDPDDYYVSSSQLGDHTIYTKKYGRWNSFSQAIFETRTPGVFTLETVPEYFKEYPVLVIKSDARVLVLHAPSRKLTQVLVRDNNEVSEQEIDSLLDKLPPPIRESLVGCYTTNGKDVNIFGSRTEVVQVIQKEDTNTNINTTLALLALLSHK